jgi:hypothetical protein
MERRTARAHVREHEEEAIKQAIKENIQNSKTAQKEQEKAPHGKNYSSPVGMPSTKNNARERIEIRPVGVHATDKKENNHTSRPIRITQECDSVMEEGVKEGPKISFLTPRQFAANALYHVVGCHIESYSNNFVPMNLKDGIGNINVQIPFEEVGGAGVVNPETGDTLTDYEQLLKVPALRKIWSAAMCKELGHLANDWENEEGTKTIEFMSIDEIKEIPKGCIVTYARIVVDYCPQKKDPNQVRITVGGNLIDYPGEPTTRITDMITSKILWNSTLSTPNARYMCADMKNFYLCTPMDRPEYMKMKADLFPPKFMDKYKLHDKIYKGFIWIQIVQTMYGLPQAGILSNKLLRKRLAADGYFELPHNQGYGNTSADQSGSHWQ